MMSSTTIIIDHAFSWILPPPYERQPYTWKTAPLMFTSVVLLLISSYIRLRCTSLSSVWRFGFGLVAIPISFIVPLLRYNDWILPEFFYGMTFTGVMIDFVLGVNSIFTTLLIAEFLFMGKEEDFDVKGSKEFQQWQKSQSKQNKKKLNGHDHQEKFSLERPRLFPGTNRWLELDLTASLRGLGFKRGLDQDKEMFEAGYKSFIDSQKISKEEATRLKWSTLIKVVRMFFVCFLVMDFIETFYRNPTFFPDQCKNGPCSLEDFKVQNSLGRYGTTILSTMLGVFLVADMQAYYCLVYIFALLFTTKSSDIPITISLYEPILFFRPHISTSLKDLWGIHWHALFRRPFLLFAYRPAHKIGTFFGLPKKVARALGILATFALSGLLHEMCLESNLPHFQNWDPNHPQRTSFRGFGGNRFVSSRFFLAQGFGIIFEDLFINSIEPILASILFNSQNDNVKKSQQTVLIRKGIIRNIVGWIWCMSFVIYFGYGLIDIWLRHGITTLQFTFSFTKPITESFINYLSSNPV